MKQQVNPALIAGAVVVLALVVFGIYKLAMGGSSGDVSKSNAPDYARASQQGRGSSMADYYTKQQQELQQKGGGAPGGQRGGGYGRPGGPGR
jgi:hypothetical protein